MNTDKMSRRQTYVNMAPIELRGLVTKLDAIGFFDAPASIKYHGAYEGGLFDHSYEVTTALIELTEKLGLKWKRPESPFIVGMFHDLCKTDAYRMEFNEWTYNRDALMPDHGSLSIMIAQTMVMLTDEELFCIRWHMGAFEKDPRMWEYYSRAIEQYPNVLYTHTADMIASKVRGI